MFLLQILLLSKISNFIIQRYVSIPTSFLYLNCSAKYKLCKDINHVHFSLFSSWFPGATLETCKGHEEYLLSEFIASYG